MVVAVMTNILIVEDECDPREVLRDFCSVYFENANISLAENSMIGKKFIDGNMFDYIFMDHNLGGNYTGMQLADYARQNSNNDAIITNISGTLSQINHECAHKLFDFIMPKPFQKLYNSISDIVNLPQVGITVSLNSNGVVNYSDNTSGAIVTYSGFNWYKKDGLLIPCSINSEEIGFLLSSESKDGLTEIKEPLRHVS